MIQFSKASIGKEEEKAVLDVLRSGWIAAGPKTEQFEQEFAKYVGVKYAIFTNSGTAALKMAYKYMKEEADCKEVFVPKNTFCATYSAAIETGLEVVHKLDPFEPWRDLEKVNVHYGGVKDAMICYLEDSAHRIETNDSLVGKIRIYSFYVTKNMTTGAGGMLVTDYKDIYEKCRLYWRDGINKSTFDRQHGGWNYTVEAMVGGYDGNDLAASMGIEQLKKLPKFTQERNDQRDLYNEAFNQDWSGNHLYPYFVKDEKEVDNLLFHLKDSDIQASYHYPGTGWLGVSLPIYPLLTASDQHKIIEEVLLWRKLNT